jgi:hypothetical protein
MIWEATKMKMLEGAKNVQQDLAKIETVFRWRTLSHLVRKTLL